MQVAVQPWRTRAGLGSIPRSWERLGGFGAGGRSGLTPVFPELPGRQVWVNRRAEGKQEATGLTAVAGGIPGEPGPTADGVPEQMATPWARRPWMLGHLGCPSGPAQAVPQPEPGPTPSGVFSKRRR